MGSQCLITPGRWHHHVYVPHTSPSLVAGLLSRFSNTGRVILFAFAVLFRVPHLASKRGFRHCHLNLGSRKVTDAKRIKSSLVIII